MDKSQTQALNDHLVAFCDSLDVQEVCIILQANGVFREHHVDQIESLTTKLEKRQQCVRLIRQRGPTAFRRFYEALVETGQHQLAQLLQPHLTPADDRPTPPQNGRPNRSMTPSPEPTRDYSPPRPSREPSGGQKKPGAADDLEKILLLAKPEIAPPSYESIEQNKKFYRNEIRAYPEKHLEEFTTKGVLEALRVEECAVDGGCVQSKMAAEELDGQFDATHVYRNFSSPKGLALIINNRVFATMPERLGTETDEVNMTRLLQQLGYHVKVKKNLTAKVL